MCGILTSFFLTFRLLRYVFFCMLCFVSKRTACYIVYLPGKRKGWEESGEGRVLDGGAESEASLERLGTEASRAAGGFGSSASGVGTLSDICLLTAAGAAGWMDGRRGGGGGWRAGAFSHNQHQHLTRDRQQQLNIMAIKSHESY